MHNPRYCLTQHSGISSNINKVTHFRTPLTLSTLANCLIYPHWCTITQSRHRSTPPTQSTLAAHPRQHVTNANTPPTLVCLPRKHATHGIQAGTNSSLIPKGNLVFAFSFYFYNLYFLGLFKHFRRNLENCHRKVKLFIENSRDVVQGGHLKCSIRSSNNELRNRFHKFVHLQLSSIKYKFVYLQLFNVKCKFGHLQQFDVKFLFSEKHIFVLASC